MAQQVKNLPAMQEAQETQVQSLGWEDPLEEEMATQPSTLSWKSPWTEEPGRSMGSQKSWLDMTEQLSTCKYQVELLKGGKQSH